MKTITCILLFYGLSWNVATQVPVSQIEGYLEVYHPNDTTSLYLGKGVARNVDNTVIRDNTIEEPLGQVPTRIVGNYTNKLKYAVAKNSWNSRPKSVLLWSHKEASQLSTIHHSKNQTIE